jgi:SAM-dependent methyltransferase
MIASAVRQHDSDRFEFHVADCSQPLDHLGLQPGTFDLVSAGWLLHYAPTRDDLVCTWANMPRYLKPGDVFIGLMHTYRLPPHQPAVGDFTFGFQWKDISPLEDGRA